MCVYDWHVWLLSCLLCPWVTVVVVVVVAVVVVVVPHLG